MILFFRKVSSVAGVNQKLQQAGLPANMARDIVYSEIDIVLCIADSLKSLSRAHKNLVASYVFLEFAGAKYDLFGGVAYEAKQTILAELKHQITRSPERHLIARTLNSVMHTFLGEKVMTEAQVLALIEPAVLPSPVPFSSKPPVPELAAAS
ncbi:hypothetical protein K0504_02265 [Neiella marina]|uniref:Uncharacterized protein n=1 Tax=Neiella holothuriorum TaxID=2870530 RepID=A0ABS7EBZ1_9GAMM|nr:hypothetical protein [Neiella holothuriorum]MBW8189846.1 hypothetical protein [Neiella holothuriorum]